jgi:16S rRNA (guanine(966)-N(2))-methyltransferase RsmD
VPRRNRVRIIGGQWRRRQLQFPAAAELRPTPDRVRETVFNWLGQTLDGKSCLDLFAGSGALGFEAASRFARHVVMVERDRLAHAALVTNAKVLEADNVEFRCEDAFRFLDTDRRIFDVVFLDPPYRQGGLPDLLAALGQHLAAGAQVYLEAADLPEIPPGYVIVRRSRAGQVNYLLLESADHGSQIQ